MQGRDWCELEGDAIRRASVASTGGRGLECLAGDTYNTPMGLANLMPRFTFNVIIVAFILSFFSRLFLISDDPSPEGNPHDILYGLCLLAISVLVAVLNELIIHRKRKDAQDNA